MRLLGGTKVTDNLLGFIKSVLTFYQITSDSVNAWGLQQLNENYSDELIQVIRTADQVEVEVEQDSNGEVSLDSAVTNVVGDTGDTTASNLGEFVAAPGYADPDSLGSATNANVVGGFDQFGSDDWVQTTNAEAPTIVESGVLNEYINFDRSDDHISCNLSSGITGTAIWDTDYGVMAGEIDVSSGNYDHPTNSSYYHDRLKNMILFNSVVGGLNVIKSELSGEVEAPSDSSYFFRGRTDITKLYVGNWNTSSVDNIRFFVMDCSNLTTLDVSSWDTSNMTNLSSFARDCSNLTTLDVSNWDVGNVTNFRLFAQFCSSITTLDTSNWDTSSVNTFRFFAYGCSSLTSLDVSNWDTSNVTDFGNFVRGCTNLTSLDVSNWDTSSVTDFTFFAFDCSSLTTVTVNGGTGNPFADSPCTDYSSAFTTTNLTEESIDDILVAIDNAGTSSGTFNQSGGSAPSSTGETAIDNLRGRSWTVSVTGGY